MSSNYKKVTSFQLVLIQPFQLSVLDTKIVIWAFDTLIMNLGLKDSPLKIVRPPYSGNPNLAAQNGVCAFWHINPMESVDLFNDKLQPQNNPSLDSLIENFLKEHGCLERIMFIFPISIKDFSDAFDYLSRNRCTASYLFPGYVGVMENISRNRALSNLICKEQCNGKTDNYYSSSKRAGCD